MKGKCALYKVEADLRESHICPKFVINQMKATGSTYLRKFAEPNRRLQDGLKFHLLSHEAEQEFGKREKYFSEEIFYPYLENPKYFEYDNRLFYFAISFLWRVLLVEINYNKRLPGHWSYSTVIKAEKVLRYYLKTENPIHIFNQPCLLLTDRLKTNTTDLKDVDYYFSRALDATIVASEDMNTLLLYGKFSRFVFWLPLLKNDSDDELIDLLIKPSGGVMNVPQRWAYQPIASFFYNRIKEINNYEKASEKQQEVIYKKVISEGDKFWNTDLGNSIINDLSIQNES